MNNFERVGAELKLGILEDRLYAFFLEYNFHDRHNDTVGCQAVQKKFAKVIAESFGFVIPEDYGMVETDTEYGMQPLASLSAVKNPAEQNGEVL